MRARRSSAAAATECSAPRNAASPGLFEVSQSIEISKHGQIKELSKC